MATGFEARNADNDILLSTEDDNQYFWIDNYTVSGVTHYGTGNATLTSGNWGSTGKTGTIPFTDIHLDSSNTDLSLASNLFFINVPEARITSASISGYTNGGFVGTNTSRNALNFQGVTPGTFPWVNPRTMNNFSGAETGYGINVYNSGGQEGGQSELKWSSNAQGHLDIVAVGQWSSAIGVGELWTDIALTKNKGPYYVLVQHLFGPLSQGSWGIYYRAPCYEFRYPDGDTMYIRLHGSTTTGQYAATNQWSSLILSGHNYTFPPGYYMIVRKRP